ncbi:MAG TPA: arabinan endo-1,5-alpha-L-arabinosidase [Rhizomicrobium sp.]|nr:arabinan endo-1,5-alpha-L-arabinosidase [Rhizomicrobium sp.]
MAYPSIPLIGRRRVLGVAAAMTGGAFLAGRLGHAQAEPQPLNSRLTGDISPVHDPCIIRQGDTYYVFCTTQRGDAPGQISCRTSHDLVNWKRIGTVFGATPGWITGIIPQVRGLWAPDISFHNGKYWLYYAASSFGSNVSAIGLATNATLDPASPDFRWNDEGVVFQSQAKDDYNCIDPAHFVDRDGQRWLAFGSFWGGIKLMKVDAKSGKPAASPELITIASRPEPEGGPDPIEGAFLIERGGWYYLFASYDFCCKGAQSNYYTAYGRSRQISGPYLGRDGRRMTDGAGVVILKANNQDEGGRWRGPGHCAILRDRDGDYIVYHAYDRQHDGAATMCIAPLVWSPDGWASAVT